MNCLKCGKEVDKLSEVCSNCGSPLNKTEEIKYNKKGNHIDIEEVTEENEEISFNETKKSVKKILFFLLTILFIFVILMIGTIIVEKFTHEIFKEYEDIMDHSSLALIYLGNKKTIDEKCNEYADNYGYDYLNIDVRTISYQKKKQLKDELNIKNLASTLVIVQNGVPISSYPNLKTKEDLLTYLQDNKLIPNIVEDTSLVLEKYRNNIVAQQATIIYLPTTYDDNTKIKSTAIQKISEENGLIYVEVEGYLLSQKQLLKIMSEIGFTTVQSDLILYINGGKIVSTIEALETEESKYFHLFLNRGIIDVTSSDSLVEIDNEQFADMVQEKNKNVFYIETDNCAYCERVRPILGKIASQNSLTIYRLNASESKEEISNLIISIGYSDGLTITPFVLIVENNKYVDSIIGLADEELYSNKFMEYGVIK